MGFVKLKVSSSFRQEKEYQMKDRIDRIKGHITRQSESIKQHLERVGDKSQEILHRWEDKSREFISDFLDLFGRDTRLVCMKSIAVRGRPYERSQPALECQPCWPR